MKLFRIFVKSDGNGLHSIRYDGEDISEWRKIYNQWFSTDYLRTYLSKRADLFSSGYYKVSLSDAIDIIQVQFEQLITKIKYCLDEDSSEQLATIFRPYHDQDYKPRLYQPTKTKESSRNFNKCFLRIYALRINDNTYVIIGGAIKLTDTTEADEELINLQKNFERVKQFLQFNEISAPEDLNLYYAE